ncbi:hypothetical protein T09_2826 [Trichinella sp. T9]|nr:hypothetical protein T09_2826 [Trichinella sp. T9]
MLDEMRSDTGTLVDGFQRKQQGVVFCWLIHSCIRLVEKRTKVVLSVEQRSTAITRVILSSLLSPYVYAHMDALQRSQQMKIQQLDSSEAEIILCGRK